MRICDDGNYRDMTPEEEMAAQNTQAPDDTAVLIDDAEALDILLGGAE